MFEDNQVGHDPAEIVYCALRAYILACVKCCQYIWSEMTAGNIYEVRN